MTRFTDLDLIDPLQHALARQGYETPTPIQAQAIPPLLDGRDLLGCAQTGTGKTAAFLLPVLQSLHEDRLPGGRRPIRALVLTPTRELAAQIGDSATAYGRFLKLRHTVIFGGTKEGAQIRALRAGIDILIATPGRLLDLEGRDHIDLSQVEYFVLDEADRMLDMGFIHDVRRVLDRLPKERQNLLFSATMPKSIIELAGRFLHDPVSVSVTPTATTVERIDQQVLFMPKTEKRDRLIGLLRDPDMERAIVFTRTKHGANRLAKQLDTAGIGASAIHGNKSQANRTKTLAAFRAGRLRVLVATDLASRGIDVDDVSHVFNYELPNIPDSYVHRIGRTARAGRSGVAISLCDDTERPFLRDIERLIGQAIPGEGGEPRSMAERDHAEARPGSGRSGGGRSGGGRSGGGRSGSRSRGRSSGGGGGRGGRSRTRTDERGGESRSARPRQERGSDARSGQGSQGADAASKRRKRKSRVRSGSATPSFARDRSDG